MGETLKLQGRYQAALEWYRKALGVDRNYAVAHAGMGDALLRLRRFDKAVPFLSKAASLRPYAPMAWYVNYLLGRAREELGQVDEAAEHYERTLQFRRRNPDALVRLAVLRVRQKRYDEALALSRTVVEVFPSNASAHTNLGVVLYQLKRYEEALQSFELALSLDPKQPNALAGARVVRKALQR